ncbi:MAG: hypothetical protein HYZ28_24395 [Myxococcales bacterium]|nr:hypothetical protein [Myxococcales bacterium]
MATAPDGEVTELFFQRPGQAALSPAVASFRHEPGAVALGAVLPGARSVVAVAQLYPAREPSFASALVWLEPGRPPLFLADRVYHATRPLVTSRGRVFVSRGSPGQEPTLEQAQAGQLRVDALTVDEVDLASGKSRTVHSFAGYLTFLAGALGEELLVYRVRHGHADLVAVHADTGGLRVLVPSLPPFARDFAVDQESLSLLYTVLEPSSRAWVVERLGLISLERRRLAQSPRPALFPHPWPGGRLAYNPEASWGLFVGGLFRAPMGPGVDQLRGFSRDGSFAAAVHAVEGELVVPFALRTADGAALRLAVPEGKRIDVAGFVEAAR